MKAFFALLGVFFKNLLLTTANFSRSGKKRAKAAKRGMVLTTPP